MIDRNSIKFCKICGSLMSEKFSTKILSKYTATFFQCQSCSFLQIPNPSWLKEAYKESINLQDTGILARNNYLSKQTASIIILFFNFKARFLDYAGGYGLLVRLMRDMGFDFSWMDKYTKNIFAKNFESTGEQRFELTTCFECFEHFTEPKKELESLLEFSDSILLSTSLLPTPTPSPDKWWYYGLEHGQHVSFYSLRSLIELSHRYNLFLYSNKRDIHLLTKKRISPFLFYFATNLISRFITPITKLLMKSLTLKDMYEADKQKKAREKN